MKNKLSVGLLIFCLAVPLGTSAKTLNLRDFEEKLRKANELEGILANSPEGKLLKSLNNIADSIDGDKPNVKNVDNALTLVNSTDLIEELLPKDVSISFDKGFLAGSGLRTEVHNNCFTIPCSRGQVTVSTSMSGSNLQND